MLKEDFIPVAFDQWYLRQQKDTEGDFYRKIISKGPRPDVNKTTQGSYIADANGNFYSYNNNRGPERIRRLMVAALKNVRNRDEFKPLDDTGKSDSRFLRNIPEGGSVVRVHAKVLGGYEKTNDPWKKLFHDALARDNMWIAREEIQELAQGKISDSLAYRIVRFHLIDNTRGEPPMWRINEVQDIEMKISKDGKMTGNVHLEMEDGKRGFRGQILGFVKTRDNRLTRFDMVAKGQYWGEGRYTGGAPQGKFPFAVAFQLGDGKDAADVVAPQGTKGWMTAYLKADE